MRERRRHVRYFEQRPAKLTRGRGQRYLSAETVNRSASGALLRLKGPSNLQPGQRIDLAIAEPGAAILAATQMEPAWVVRRAGWDRAPYIAVAFEQVAAQSLAAAS